MKRNLYIATRFLFSKKRAMVMSLSGIVFGVGLLVVAQAYTEGFERFFIQTVLGTDGALRIEDKFQDTIDKVLIESETGSTTQVANYRKHETGIRNPYGIKVQLLKNHQVAGVSEILRGPVELLTDLNEEFIQVYGINLDEHLTVSDLEHKIIQGDIEDFRKNPTGLLVGSMIARRGNIFVGDQIQLRHNNFSQFFRVAAIFETGIEHIDKKRVYAHMGQTRAVLQEPFGISYMQVNLFEPNRAEFFAKHAEEIFRHSTTPWQKREQVWLNVFKALGIASALTVSTIIVISGLGMFNTLAIIVMEKQKEIAILRSMGYSRRDIGEIFILQGFLVLAFGSFLGCAFATFATWGVTQIPMRIRGIFTTNHFIVHWSGWHYVYAIIAASVVVMIASYIPARQAARIEPGDIIRGTGG